MKVSEAKLRELQARGAIVKREARLSPEPVESPDPVIVLGEKIEAAAAIQSLKFSEIIDALRGLAEHRTGDVRLRVNRDQSGLIETIDVERSWQISEANDG